MPIKPVTGEIKAQPLNDNFSYLDSKVDQINGGSKETFTSLTELQSKYPNGDNSAMLVTDSNGLNGYLYTWNGASWVKGPLYQSQGIGEESVGTKEVKRRAITPDRTTFIEKIRFEKTDFKDIYGLFTASNPILTDSVNKS